MTSEEILALLREAHNALDYLDASLQHSFNGFTPHKPPYEPGLRERINTALAAFDKPVDIIWEPDPNKQPLEFADFGKLTLTVGYYPSPTTTYPWVWSVIGKAYLRGGCSPTGEEAKVEVLRAAKELV